MSSQARRKLTYSPKTIINVQGMTEENYEKTAVFMKKISMRNGLLEDFCFLPVVNPVFGFFFLLNESDL